MGSIRRPYFRFTAVPVISETVRVGGGKRTLQDPTAARHDRLQNRGALLRLGVRTPLVLRAGPAVSRETLDAHYTIRPSQTFSSVQLLGPSFIPWHEHYSPLLYS